MLRLEDGLGKIYINGFKLIHSKNKLVHVFINFYYCFMSWQNKRKM